MRTGLPAEASFAKVCHQACNCWLNGSAGFARNGRSETPGSGTTFKAAALTSNFAFAFANSLEQTSSSAGCSHRVCNQGRTNKRVFQALGAESTFNDAAQRVLRTTHVYASFTTCFTQFGHLSTVTPRDRSYCEQRAGYFADFSNNQLVCLEDLKPLALLWMFAGTMFRELLHSHLNEERLNTVSRETSQVSK
ncbi:hypothetical protein KCP71_04690 [Salmonella enterica subsp. enterica]|nr:hypothetical protein KCP71_04690 [Salmonella enterica subsp. enterica]